MHKPNIFQKRIKNWEERYGRLSNTVEKRLEELIAEYDSTQSIKAESKTLELTIGTKLVREFQGKVYSVVVLESGYEFKGKCYKSLTAIAELITGTHWNGKRFFGVSK